MAGAQPQPTTERVWIAYLLVVCSVALFPSGTDSAAHDPWTFLLLHGVVAVVVLVSYQIARRSHDASVWLRALLAVIGLPVVFSALCWLLPNVHPEPYEYTWLAIDRWLFGDDIAVLTEGMPAWFVELLQLDYAAFYGICIASALLAWLHSGRCAFNRAVLLLTGCFLCSYLGYLIFPTIAPKLVLGGLEPLQGLWLTGTLRSWIDAAEANHWDCFPSGHTMLTVTSLIILWRWSRKAFYWLLLPAVLLIASTMLLRYHWASDVAAGALLAWPCVKLCDWLASRDNWPTQTSQ